MARPAPARTAETQSVVAYMDVEADISRTVERKLQAQRVEHALTVIGDHIKAR